jgi:hypothetical protein
VTAAGTSALDGSRSSNVAPLTVAAAICSLNVAVTLVDAETPFAPLPGAMPVMTGGVSSATAVFMNTTSTQ